MDKKDGGTIDLESPWVYCKTLRMAVTTGNDSADFTLNGHGAPAGMALYSGERVAELLAELTARRARDAEVEALVAALREAMEWNWLDDDARPSRIADQCDAALAPFTGDKP